VREAHEDHAARPLGLVDASVIVLAERHNRDTIATLDHRRFATVKPAHVAGFTPVPRR
jgi:predicted nucleic acid-binding protein